MTTTPWTLEHARSAHEAARLDLEAANQRRPLTLRVASEQAVSVALAHESRVHGRQRLDRRRDRRDAQNAD